ncbi:MAG: RIP metalloprotease RseP [Spongiibacteraceae bacterium]|nr:RIP metalloprotease RseP [Spongiibacteraceae bacterium]
MEFLQTVLVTVATLVVLVTIHEYGHFWMARRCGIKVLRFSVGFGKPLYRWHDKTGTEFVIAAIPLGGYVKMLDEREGNVPEDQLAFTFNRKPVGYRLATVAAGPIANFLLAIAVYWCLFINGVNGVVPIVASVEQGSIAQMAGLEMGQEIIAVDGELSPTWQALHLQLLERIGESGPIDFSVKYPDSDVVYQSRAQLDRWLAGAEADNLMASIGLELFRPELLAVVDQVLPDSPAQAAGLQSGDRIIRADGKTIAGWTQWVDYVRSRPEQLITLVIERDKQQISLDITPAKKTDENGQVYGQVGVGVMWPEWPEDMKRSFSYGVIDAMSEAVKRTWSMSVFTLESIKKMLLGLISPKNLSGPITIAKVASASAKSGLEAYLGFLALLSVSLGVLNLLPIPVLDGGHILYGLVELLTGREVSERIQVVGYQLGAFIIAGVMILALYNDLARL